MQNWLLFEKENEVEKNTPYLHFLYNPYIQFNVKSVSELFCEKIRH